jgi:hypothetical protein
MQVIIRLVIITLMAKTWVIILINSVTCQVVDVCRHLDSNIESDFRIASIALIT